MTPMTKNVTKLARWWLDSCLKNMTNQGDRAGDIIDLDEALNCVASVVYLHCTGDKPDKTKPWLTECRSRPILMIVVSCNFSDVTKKVEILLLRDQRVQKVSWRVSWREWRRRRTHRR